MDEIEYQYMRPVSGFGWPQGYPEPVDRKHATHRRPKDDPSAPWERLPVEEAGR